MCYTAVDHLYEALQAAGLDSELKTLQQRVHEHVGVAKIDTERMRASGSDAMICDT